MKYFDLDVQVKVIQLLIKSKIVYCNQCRFFWWGGWGDIGPLMGYQLFFFFATNYHYYISLLKSTIFQPVLDCVDVPNKVARECVY